MMKKYILLLLCLGSSMQSSEAPYSQHMQEQASKDPVQLVNPAERGKTEVCCLGCIGCCCCVPVFCLCILGEKYVTPVKQKLNYAFGLAEQKAHEQ